jgi:YHS domain-containing protein
MKIILSSGLAVLIVLTLACGQGNNSAATLDTSKVAMADTSAEKSYPVSLVNNKKDPSCGMPVTAGIGDTAHYENHVLGFCSTECKNEFLKNPTAGLAAAEIK